MTGDSDMPYDDAQADLFRRLSDECGLTAKGFELHTQRAVCHRHALRIMGGSPAMTVHQTNLLLRNMVRDALTPEAAHRAVLAGDLLCGFVTDGSPWYSTYMGDALGADVDEAAIDAMRKGLDLLEQRREHKADGVITALEHREEARTIRAAISAMHRALAGNQAQTVTDRKPARTPALARA